MAAKISIRLPDLFQVFLKQKPKLNPSYQFTKRESEQWLGRICALSTGTQQKIENCDFAYFCAIAAPYASRKKFRILCDWGNWVFPFDDMFDDSTLRDEPEKAKEIMESFWEPFSGTQFPSTARANIVQAHDDLAKRLFSVYIFRFQYVSLFNRFEGIKQRYLRAMEAYCSGVLRHVSSHGAHQSPSLEEMIENRRGSIGAAPLYHLVEYCHNISLPDYIFQDPTIQELEVLGMDIVFITNDIVSYHKEECTGEPDNIIATCRLMGMSAQQAFDVAGKLLEDRYHRWEVVEANVSKYNEQVDEQLSMYVEAIKAVVRANLYWSFKTDRYTEDDPEKVRQTRKITVLENPPYLGRETP
ncbi:hypothetical protein QQS21_005218 [Conoideocrella luteorostrata]|uniref:Terpene synthase n=1 Tax=Conoideocrella luteorostrata TaxID=1105319 RepID=A0AAJ0CSX2_9HYPO|nr:hypothetical protein QQS21_005218 [Conoideocrella luteorostrata]